MTRNRALLLCLFTLLMTLSCMGYVQLARDYTEIGRGLIPTVAYPMAVLCLVLIVALWCLAIRFTDFTKE